MRLHMTKSNLKINLQWPQTTQSNRKILETDQIYKRSKTTRNSQFYSKTKAWPGTPNSHRIWLKFNQEDQEQTWIKHDQKKI